MVRQALASLAGVSLVAAFGCGGRTLGELADGGVVGTASGGRVQAGAGANPGTNGGASGAGGVSTSDGGSAGGPHRWCDETVDLTPLPVVMEYLTDTSLSMRRPLEGDSVRRWDHVRDALSDAFLSLPSDRWGGIACYPNIQLASGSPVCFLPTDTVPIAPLNEEQRRLGPAALSAKQIFGATPTEDAYAYALERLALTKQRGSLYIVLTTDGPPTYGRNCGGDGLTPVDTGPLERAIEDATALGVRTFVVGLGPEETSNWMSALAVAGNTAPRGCRANARPFCHYQAAGGPSVTDALAGAYYDIAQRSLPCVREARGRGFVALDDVRELRVVNLRTGIEYPATTNQRRGDCVDGAQVFESQRLVELCAQSCSDAGTDEMQLRFKQTCK